MNDVNKYKNNIILVFKVLIGVFLFTKLLLPILLPFIFGVVISLLFIPFTNLLEKIKIPRKIGALIIIVSFISLLLFMFYYGSNKLSNQLIMLLDKTPSYIEIFSDVISEYIIKIDNFLVGFPPLLSEVFISFKENFTSILMNFMPKLSPTGVVTKVPKLFVNLCISLFVSYFFTLDKNLIKKMYSDYISPLFGEIFDNTKKDIVKSLIGYVKTQLILMLYVCGVCFIGLTILKSEYTIVLSISIAIIDALPIFGSGFFLWPISVYYILIGEISLGLGYLLLYIVLQALRQLLQPKILGDQIGLPPLLAIFSLYIGYEFLGFIGFILGPVIAIFLRVLLKSDTNEQKNIE